MKRYYKEYLKKTIGDSDIAALIAVGVTNGTLTTQAISFGGDNEYTAYIVDSECDIPLHYDKAATFNKWCRIYDDTGLTQCFEADEINVYRAGDYGCIIELINKP